MPPHTKAFLPSISIMLFSVSTFALVPPPEETYPTMRSHELVVQYSDLEGNSLSGKTVFEKVQGALICQKSSADKIKPVYAYECYTEIRTADAEDTYLQISNPELLVSFQTLDGNQMVGSQTYEKQTETLLCRKQTTISPDPSFSYHCFSK